MSCVNNYYLLTYLLTFYSKFSLKILTRRLEATGDDFPRPD